MVWRQEKVTLKAMCEGSGRAKSTAMKLLADTKDLSRTEAHKHKFNGRKGKKTSHTDAIMNGELLKNSQLAALGLKNIHADLLLQVTIKAVHHHLQKDLGLPSCKAAKKPLAT